MIAKVKRTGEILEIYRVWGGSYQDVNKRSFHPEELEFENFFNIYEDEKWVGRNRLGFLYLFEDEPEWDPYEECWDLEGIGIYLGYTEIFSDLKPGEKRKVKMTLSI